MTLEKDAIPNNIEAEQAIISMLLYDNNVLETIGDIISEDCFYVEIHRKIFSLIKQTINRGRVADKVTLRTLFESKFGGAEGVEYLDDLTVDGGYNLSFALDYSRLLHNLNIRRQLIRLADELKRKAMDESLENDAINLVEEAESDLYRLATVGEVERSYLSFSNSSDYALARIQTAMKSKGKLAGMATHLTDLDKYLGGLRKSNLIVVAGRPGMGKTALATNIAFEVARDYLLQEGREGGGVLMFSLEMSAVELTIRILAGESGLSSDSLSRGFVNNGELTRVVAAVKDFENVPFYIDDTPGLSIDSIRSRARRIKRKENISLIVIDYIQLLGGSAKTQGNRVQEVSEVTRGLKLLAKELDVPVIALSQLKRANMDGRESNRPQLTDLRDSGSIEQDADSVIFIHREEYYLFNDRPVQKIDEDHVKFFERERKFEEKLKSVEGKAEIIIGKNRHGSTDIINVAFIRQSAKFANLDE